VENVQRGIMAIPTIYPRNAKTENVHNKNENAEDNAIRDTFADNETTNGGVFRKRKHPVARILPPSCSISNTDIITKNFEISSEPNHTMKSIEEILESVPKSYHAHLLMKHLFRKVLDRISRDEHGIVIIDGNIVKDSNITDLINDAMREKKTVKAAGNQFARLLRISNIPFALVRNKRLYHAQCYCKQRKTSTSREFHAF